MTKRVFDEFKEVVEKIIKNGGCDRSDSFNCEYCPASSRNNGEDKYCKDSSFWYVGMNKNFVQQLQQWLKDNNPYIKENKKAESKKMQLFFDRSYVFVVENLIEKSVRFTVTEFGKEPGIIGYESVYEKECKVSDKVSECFNFLEDWIHNRLEKDEKYCLNFVGDRTFFAGIKKGDV